MSIKQVGLIIITLTLISGLIFGSLSYHCVFKGTPPFSGAVLIPKDHLSLSLTFTSVDDVINLWNERDLITRASDRLLFHLVTELKARKLITGKEEAETKVVYDEDKEKFVTEEVEKFTYEQYLKIKEGMSYEEVVEILGSEGKEISRSTIGEDTTVMVTWTNPDFSSITTTFQNDKVYSKVQFNLE